MAGRGIASWRKVPPSCDDEQAESCVCQREDPERSFVVEDTLNPVFDEARGVRGLTTLPAQPRLQDGEWAELAEPSLNYDNTDCDQMHDTERQCIDPTPVPHVANEHEEQAADDKGNDCEVQEQNRVRKQAVGVRVLHLRSLTNRVERHPAEREESGQRGLGLTAPAPVGEVASKAKRCTL